MLHENFSRSGAYSAPELGVYAGWVAHEHSFASDPTLAGGSENTALLLSGECYDDADRIRELRKGPAHWLINLYEKSGEPFVEELNGLFSGLLVDRARKRALLFNDRYGFGRIYWHETKDAFYFASEAKALLRILPELRAFDDEGLAQFLALGTTIENRTLFRGVQLLPAASAWMFENGTRRQRTYFSPIDWESQPLLSAERFQEEFEETFNRVVPRYCETPSQIGISLTAGLDSRMLMACLPASAGRPVCYTYAGTKGETLDARLAKQVADVCHLDHALLRIGPDFFSEFAAHADRTVYLTDGYSGILGAHEIYLNRQARKLAAIRLTGVFGGEILRSVSTFKPIGLSPELLDPESRRNVDMQVGLAAKQTWNPVTFAAFREIPWNIFGSLAATCSQVSFRTPYLDNDIVSLAFRAPASARTSESAVLMVQKYSGALAKVPTDMGLLADNKGLSGAWSRVFSKVTFKLDYFSNDGMPHWLSRFDPVVDQLNSNKGIVGLHKYLRYRRWFRRELAGYLETSLNDPEIQGPWNLKFIRRMALEHISGRKNYLVEMNAVLTLSAVQRLMFRSEQ